MTLSPQAGKPKKTSDFRDVTPQCNHHCSRCCSAGLHSYHERHIVDAHSPGWHGLRDVFAVWGGTGLGPPLHSRSWQAGGLGVIGFPAGRLLCPGKHKRPGLAASAWRCIDIPTNSLPAGPIGMYYEPHQRPPFPIFPRGSEIRTLVRRAPEVQRSSGANANP